MVVQRLMQIIQKLGRQQMLGADVDGDMQLQSLGPPLRALGQRLIEHEAANGARQAPVIEHAGKLGRLHLPALL